MTETQEAPWGTKQVDKLFEQAATVTEQATAPITKAAVGVQSILERRIANASAAVVKYVEKGSVPVADDTGITIVSSFESARQAKLRKLERVIGILTTRATGESYAEAIELWAAVHTFIRTAPQEVIYEQAGHMSPAMALHILTNAVDSTVFADAITVLTKTVDADVLETLNDEDLEDQTTL